MNISRARELLLKAARGLQGDDSLNLEEAAMTFARVKQRNANRRDRWKVRKRLMSSREGSNETEDVICSDDGFHKSV